MTLNAPYPPELIRVARKVVWYESPAEALSDLPAFLAQAMVYGAPADVRLVERYSIGRVSQGAGKRTGRCVPERSLAALT